MFPYPSGSGTWGMFAIHHRDVLTRYYSPCAYKCSPRGWTRSAPARTRRENGCRREMERENIAS